jgi:putative ABC transport system permease protein
MKSLFLFFIGRATPARDREWLMGDTLEQLQEIEAAKGRAAARRWLWSEMWRVLWHAPRHRLAVRSPVMPAASTRGDGPMAGIRQDLRYALRVLARSPGFTAVAIATLALGIGANTAMFAVVNAVLLKPLPFRDAERLMLVSLLVPDRETPGTYHEGVWSYPKYRTFLDVQSSFEDTAMFDGRDYNLAGDDNPERVRGEVVTAGYPEILGLAPHLGRGFTADEAHRAGAPPVALIGHDLWKRRYGGDPAVLGRTISVNATPHTVVGVLPRGFKGLSGNAELWVPLAVLEPTQLTERQSHSYSLIARRKADVAEQAAIAAVRVNGGQVDAQYSDRGGPEPWGAGAASLYASRADVDIRRASFILLGAVGFVLLIACVNLTNLLVAKALARRREVAIRLAIGASRGRVARQFVAESLLLAGLGAVGGLVVAAILLNIAAILLPDADVFFRSSMAPGARRIAGASGLTRIGASMIGLDATTVLFTCVVTIVTAGLIALVPALQGSSLRPWDTLKASGSMGGVRGLHGLSAHGALVTAQIALALVLLTGAGLMVKSAARLQGTGIGVDGDGVLTMRFDLPRATYTEEKGRAFYAQLTERVRAVPGVESAALANCPPVTGGCSGTIIWFNRTPLGPGQDPLVGIHWATPEYFPTLGIRLVQGRNFTEHDRMGQPRVALVNEAAARALWPGGSPLGKLIWVGQGGFGGGSGAEVVGIISNVRYRAIETAATPDVYIPLAQSSQGRMTLFVRSRLDPHSLVPAITREVRTLDPNLPVGQVKTMDERMGDAMWRTRVGAWLLSAFAALALLLTAIGIFGVMSQTVTQRTPEIGVRIALGAQGRDVLKLFLRRAAVVTALGVVIGVACALALTRVLGALLYDVRATDPSTFISVALLLGLVALGACYIPARRATRVDAMVALRAE